MWENAYLSIKTQKLPGPLSGPWTPGTDSSLRSHDSTPLHRQLSASEAGAPLDQILDPHLLLVNFCDFLVISPFPKSFNQIDLEPDYTN